MARIVERKELVAIDDILKEIDALPDEQAVRRVWAYVGSCIEAKFHGGVPLINLPERNREHDDGNGDARASD